MVVVVEFIIVVIKGGAWKQMIVDLMLLTVSTMLKSKAKYMQDYLWDATREARHNFADQLNWVGNAFITKEKSTTEKTHTCME